MPFHTALHLVNKPCLFKFNIVHSLPISKGQLKTKLTLTNDVLLSSYFIHQASNGRIRKKIN